MPQLALNFICKNEGHVIERMLESARSFTDLVVAVDTGSSDDTISLIRGFGDKHAIPTYVFERPFDDFGNSRNYALDRLREVIEQLGWASEETWGFFIDCDEVIILHEQFKKKDLKDDIYIATVRGAAGSFTRQFLFHLSKLLRWEGPIHEMISCADHTATYGMIDSLYIYYESKGASWDTNLEAKFINYANLLTKYISEGHETFRWVFYTGESYSAAASYCKSIERKRELALQAKKFYEKALLLDSRTIDEKIIICYRIAESRSNLEEDWPEIYPYFLKAFALDSRRAESIAQLITHYMTEQQWEVAYLFSCFAVKEYHGNNPFGQGVAETIDRLYQWKLLWFHAICCYKSGRKKEASITRAALKQYVDSNQEIFSYKDLVYIQSNSPVYLSIRKINPFKKQQFAV